MVFVINLLGLCRAHPRVMFVLQFTGAPTRCLVLPPYVRLALKSIISEPRPRASDCWKFFEGVREIAIRQLEPKLLMALGRLPDKPWPI